MGVIQQGDTLLLKTEKETFLALNAALAWYSWMLL